IEIVDVASGFRIQVKAGMVERLQRLWEERAPRYSRALFETLALVAYRQPITRGEIEEVRGVSVSANIIRTLLEREWVRVVGHRDVPGRPAMFGTTRQFLDYFGLKKLDDLPPLADLADWESLRVQLNLPEVEETEDEIQESADIAELPVLQPALVAEEESDDEPAPADEELRRAEALADTGFEEIVASEWPDPASSVVTVLDGDGDGESEGEAVEESRNADASAHSA
ncbi:MAG: SMC-Scp complex subunit ScpB, partial [Gammaproteobacteria bacterium]|nr:SMC-Scp complex subunit ScpB [Gammaproteobacteria bacterium]